MKLKLIKSLGLMFLTIFVMASCGLAQTAVSDSGSVDNDQVFQKDVTFAGTISGTDTSFTNPVKVENVADVFSTYYSLANANDSIRVKLVRQITGFAPSANKWVDAKTVLSADSVSGNFAISDTLVYKNKYIRYVIIGVSDNGYTTSWSLKNTFTKN